MKTNRRYEPLPAPPAEKSFKILVDGKHWAKKRIYPDFVQTREAALESVRDMFENVIGKTWDDKGGKEIKIEFCGGPLTYDEWRKWQQEKTEINFFGVTAELRDEEGFLIQSDFLVCWSGRKQNEFNGKKY
jgi:hypothetical protein